MAIKQKLFAIRIVQPKGFKVGSYDHVRASSPEIAKRKFKRTSVFRRQKVLGVSEIKI